MKKILIWDWDGTLVDSIDFKYDAIWDEVFLNEPDKQKIIKSWIQTPDGKKVNRYGLIQHALMHTDMPEVKDFSDEQLKTNQKFSEYIERYDNAAKRHTQESGLFDGVADMLKELYEDGYHMYVISGGGEDEGLRNMVENLEVKKYFKEIFGFGQPGMSLVRFGKYENFKRVTAVEEDTEQSNYVIIGDGKTDKTFAEGIGAGFIGVANKWNKWEESKKKNIVAQTRDVIKFI